MQLNLTKKRIIVISAVVILAGVAAYAKLGGKPEAEYVTAKAVKGNLVQTVSETGSVKAASELSLNFLNSGKVAMVNVGIGEAVKKGQVLAELDHTQLDIKKRQAEANLSKLLAGATAEDLAVAGATVKQAEAAYAAAIAELDRTKRSAGENTAQAERNLADLESVSADDVTNFEQAVTTAEINLDNVKKTYAQSLANKIDSALAAAEDKLISAGIALDNVNKILTDDDAQNVLSVKNSIFLSSTMDDYDRSKALIVKADSDLSIAKGDKRIAKAGPLMDGVFEVLGSVSMTLSDCYKALENSIISSSFTQTELDAAKSSISGQQTVVSAAIASVQASKQALSDAELAYDTNVASAENSLTQAKVSLNNAVISARNALNTAKLAGDQQITAAQSKVDSSGRALDLARSQLAKAKAPAREQDIALAGADLDAVKSQIDNSFIKAPLDGVITKVNYKAGEDISLAKPAILMLGEDDFEVEILVSEADIAKVNKDDKTEVTFDAFPGDVRFKGQVFFIEPAETLVQDVVYYKVKVKLSDREEVEDRFGGGIKIKPGMTANVVITTAEKNDALIVPARALVEKSDGSRIVRVLSGGRIGEVPVVLGLRGDEGLV